jgi:hypothetical protein
MCLWRIAPTREVTLHLKAAEALGLTGPPTLLSHAGEVMGSAGQGGGSAREVRRRPRGPLILRRPWLSAMSEPQDVEKGLPSHRLESPYGRMRQGCARVTAHRLRWRSTHEARNRPPAHLGVSLLLGRIAAGSALTAVSIGAPALLYFVPSCRTLRNSAGLAGEEHVGMAFAEVMLQQCG